MSVPLRWQQPVETQEVVRPTPSEVRRKALRGTRRMRAIGVLALLAALCAVTAGVGLRLTRWFTAAEQTLRFVPEAAAGAQVTLGASSVERRLGFVTVTGNMENHGPHTLTHVEAVVELLDASNRTVALDSALLPLDTVRTGQSAPFQVEMQDRPGAVAYRVHFRRLLGASLN